MGKRNKISLLVLSLGIFLLPSFLTTNYPVMVLNIAAFNALVVLGLNLLIGFAGQISLGHAAFFGLGAYLSAILTATAGMPIPIAMLLATAITAAVAYLLAIPTLKLEGHYLVMATLGFNVIVSILLIQWDSVTGGPSGFAGIPPLALGSFTFDSDRKIFYLVWSVVLLALILSLNLIHSRVGRAMAALAHNETAARCAGIDTEDYKIKIFLLSAVFASLAGSLYAHYLQFISPGTFSIFYSIQIVTMVLVGGIHSLWGSMFGALFLTILPELLQVIKDYSVLVYGGTLMGVLIFFPQGLFPAIGEAFRKRPRAEKPLANGAGVERITPIPSREE